jgi:hypothetical protein
MINTSMEYRQYITGVRQFYSYAQITLADDTVLNLNNTHIINLKIDDAVSQSNSFTVGAAIINKLTLAIDNSNEQFSQYDFYDAVIRPSIGLQLSATIETLNKGVFSVDTANTVGSTIVITALDNMHYFDSDYSDSTQTYPATIYQITSEICTRHGLTLATSTFTNYNLTIDSRPADDALTDREMIAYCAQIAGCFARFNTSGALEFKWYDMAAFYQSDNLDGGYFDSDNPYSSGDNVDGGNFTDYNSGDSYDGGTFLQMSRYHHIYSLTDKNIAVDDVVITGLQIATSEEEPVTVIYGTAGYVVAIASNPLIQTEAKATAIASVIGPKIVGMKLRPLSVSARSDPSIEAGDVGYVSDNKGNTYQALFSTLSFQINNSERIACDAETPSRNQSKRYDAITKTYIENKKNTQRQITTYDATVQQITNLITNGFGLFQTKITDSGGGTIYYLHDKPSINESTYRWLMTSGGMIQQNKIGGVWVTVGGTDNQGNALYNVITARGLNADWINAGSLSSQNGQSTIDLNDGTFSLGNARLVWNGTKLSIVGEITASSGKIGPFDISNAGLMSDIMQFFENENQPLIWLTKKGPGGEDWGSEVDGTQRANYEPAVAAVRAVEDGIQTDVYIQARDNLQGDFGVFEIDRFEVSSGMPVSRVKATENGMVFEKYSSGSIEKSFEINLNVGNIAMESNGKSYTMIFDDNDGTLYIQADKVVINGHEF